MIPCGFPGGCLCDLCRDWRAQAYVRQTAGRKFMRAQKHQEHMEVASLAGVALLTALILALT